MSIAKREPPSSIQVRIPAFIYFYWCALVSGQARGRGSKGGARPPMYRRKSNANQNFDLRRVAGVTGSASRPARRLRHQSRPMNILS